MSELAALGTVFVVTGFLFYFFFFFKTALAADGGSWAATRNCISCTCSGDRGVRVSGGCTSTGCGVGIGDTSGGIAAAHTTQTSATSATSATGAHTSAAHTSAAHTHTHASATTGVDDDMGHARMTSDNLSIHSDGGHPTSDVGYLLALGFDTGRSRKLVPVSEL